MVTGSMNELAAEIHANAVAHGWWETDRSDEECLFLAITELAELFDSYRRGTLDAQCDKPIPLTNFQEELADFVIRILDWCGARGIEFSDGTFTHYVDETEVPLSTLIWDLQEIVNRLHFPLGRTFMALVCLSKADDLASRYGFDLWGAVGVKHDYNKTRPYRHGGLKA